MLEERRQRSAEIIGLTNNSLDATTDVAAISVLRSLRKPAEFAKVRNTGARLLKAMSWC